MRLINVYNLALTEFTGSQIPLYAILSHTWDPKNELSLADMANIITKPEGSRKSGFAKIEYCCRQAKKDGLSWAWVDTCCIDKTSSAELTEAINSMYRWYSSAVVCYAYLSDVHKPEDLHTKSQADRPLWFTRGWTLQELIAPLKVVFYSSSWIEIGTKQSMAARLSSLTGIPTSILLHQDDVLHISVARRMSWASRRTTTRSEDIAYCLLGIFGINMPLLYGEGRRAFVRLQEEILRRTNDQTVFLGRSGMLSEHPWEFSEVVDCEPSLVPFSGDPPRLADDQLHIDLRVRMIPSTDVDKQLDPEQWVVDHQYSDEVLIQAALNCHKSGREQLVRMFLVKRHYSWNDHVMQLLLIPGTVEWMPVQE
ncbi:heterokaryon incompatibility protein-domain-containing protein [Xylariales sp. AK1849]|nr:heterokaryon incompatibility protein-domain-containing protein [Xylariales sp. AK1849]